MGDFMKNIKIKYIVSILATLIFSLYNLYLGCRYNLVWNFSISIYYILLLIIKEISLFEFIHSNRTNKEYKKNIYVLTSIISILISFILIGPSILMIENKREVNVTLIPALAIATFTFYKITIAIINYKKYYKTNSLYRRQEILINLISALVSILTLQNTLIYVTSSDVDQSLFILTIVSSIAIILLIGIISVKSLKNSLKITQKNKDNYIY